MTIDQNEVPPFSDHYHRARRNLILVSALLLSWEYIGFELGDKLSTSVTDLTISIKHKDTIPSIIAVLVVFFAFRYFIEWKQSSSLRVQLKYSQWDFKATICLCICSLFVFGYQKTTGLDLAPVLRPTFDTPLFWIGATVCMFFVAAATGYLGDLLESRSSELPFIEKITYYAMMIAGYAFNIIFVITVVSVVKYLAVLSGWF